MSGITVKAACFILLLIIGGCSEQTALKYIPPEGVILAFGDSLTQGVGSSNDGDYPSQLQQLTGRTVINAGISGEVSRDGLQRLPALLQQYQPNLLILLEGGNDILRNQDKTILKHNLAQMITQAQQQHIDVVLVAVPEKKLFSNSAPLYRELAEEYALVWEPEIIAELLRSPSYKSDAVHFNNQGYQALAARINALLKEHNAL
ncbi:arylesterase [Amphritea opalescens]|uniref:Arylesterase n=1 Tax=Amphritea opalescens TaxID=2490544 RepID=A0A430KNA8_9GAMM|nr:GDSL-type esterase/lipase family protein [Amphritea opalescens]RTE64946.1 arylesterase [Amphritea opalescens]